MRAFKAVMGVLWAVAAAGLAYRLGPEPEPLLESIGGMAIVAGPGFALLALPVLRTVEGTSWLAAGLVGMAAGLANLFVVLLMLTPVVGFYVVAVAQLFFLPFLAGGAALGLGCRRVAP
jgi:hypothetical protein